MKQKVRLSLRKEHGFTLIEMLIVLLLLGILALGLVIGLTTGIKAAVKTDIQDTARNLAEAQMENVQTQLYDAVNNPPIYSELPAADPSGLNLMPEVEATRLDRGSGTGIDTGIQQIMVKIWQVDKVVFTLEGQKVK